MVVGQVESILLQPPPPAHGSLRMLVVSVDMRREERRDSPVWEDNAFLLLPHGSIPEHSLHDNDPAHHANHAQAGRGGKHEERVLRRWVLCAFCFKTSLVPSNTCHLLSAYHREGPDRGFSLSILMTVLQSKCLLDHFTDKNLRAMEVRQLSQGSDPVDEMERWHPSPGLCNHPIYTLSTALYGLHFYQPPL